MFKKLAFSLLGLVLLLLMLAAALPAKLLIRAERLPPALRIDGISGQWWSGQAALVTWYDQPRGQLSWRYQFPDAVKFRLGDGLNEVRSTISLSTLLGNQNQVVFRQLAGQWQAAQLPPVMQAVRLEGELVFNLSEVRAVQNQRLNLTGHIIWHQARLSGGVALDLGQVDIAAQPQQQETAINLTNNNSGDVLLTGKGILAADHYALELNLRAGFGRDELRRQLALLGQLNPDGSSTLRLSGQY